MTESSLIDSWVLKLRAMKRSRKLPMRWVKIHGGAYQRPGLPDLWICIAGHLITLEAKLPEDQGGEDATPLQQHELKMLKKAGATTAVVRTWAEVRQIVEAVIERMQLT